MGACAQSINIYTLAACVAKIARDPLVTSGSACAIKAQLPVSEHLMMKRDSCKSPQELKDEASRSPWNFSAHPDSFVNGKVAYDKLVDNIATWNRTGLKGYVAFGSNGEYVYLSEEEKARGRQGGRAERRTRHEGDRRDRLRVHLADDPAHQRVRQAGSARRAGGDSLLLWRAHERRRAAAAFHGRRDQADIPILIYNVTKFTNINVSVALVAKLSRHPNIIGIKDSNGNVGSLGEMVGAVDKDFSVLVGTAGALSGPSPWGPWAACWPWPTWRRRPACGFITL